MHFNPKNVSDVCLAKIFHVMSPRLRRHPPASRIRGIRIFSHTVPRSTVPRLSRILHCLQIHPVEPASTGGGVTVVDVVAEEETDCRAEFETGWGLPAYVTWVTLAIYVLPIIALISVYTRICLAVWRSDRYVPRPFTHCRI